MTRQEFSPLFLLFCGFLLILPSHSTVNDEGMLMLVQFLVCTFFLGVKLVFHFGLDFILFFLFPFFFFAVLALRSFKQAISEDPLSKLSDWDTPGGDRCVWSGVSCFQNQVISM